MDNIDKCPECGADVEPDTIPDTGEEDDIREYNQQLQAMYTRGYREGRLAGYTEALIQKASD